MTKKELIDILESPDFNVSLDGGNDSGSFYISGIENEELRDDIENLLYDNCDYGSFAGNYSVAANGGWNKEKQAIILEGDEIDYEQYEEEIEKNIVIPISDLIYQTVDSVSINIDFLEEESNVQVRVNIKNGRWLEEHSEFEENIKKEIESTYNDNYPIAYTDENYLLKDKNKFEFSFFIGKYKESDVYIQVTVEEILEQLDIKDE